MANRNYKYVSFFFDESQFYLSNRAPDCKALPVSAVFNTGNWFVNPHLEFRNKNDALVATLAIKAVNTMLMKFIIEGVGVFKDGDYSIMELTLDIPSKYHSAMTKKTSDSGEWVYYY